MSFEYKLKENGKIMEVQDPIYGKIQINSPFTEIILTKEMQRLNGITQNGFSVFEYPGLKNNERLSHSVGAFHVMSEIVKQLEKEPGRDDYAFVTDNLDYKLIWVCKMQPLWQDEGFYKLLGVGMSFPSKDYHSLNLLVKDLKKRLI